MVGRIAIAVVVIATFATGQGSIVSATETCNVQPRTEPVPTHAATPTDIISEIPPGQTPDAQTSTALMEAALTLDRCGRVGTLGQYLTLLTEDYARSGIGPVTDLANQANGNPERVLLGISNLMLVDPTTASLIQQVGGIEDAHPDPGQTWLLMFKKVDDRWLLNGQYDQVWDGRADTEPTWIADLYPY